MPNLQRVLVVDDDIEMARFISDLLASSGYKARGVTSGSEATRVIEQDGADVVITDMRMGDVSGLDLIAWIKRYDPRVAVIAITAFGSIETAIRAIKLGAFDYVTKPFSPEAIVLAVERATRDRQMRVELIRLREEVDRTQGIEGIVGRSASMQEIISLVRRVSLTTTSVLVTGGSGTGKKTIARAIHRLSARKTHPFVSFPCASIPPALIDTELFGSESSAAADGRERLGALREAEGGTLLLEDVNALPLATQGRLLRVLEDRAVRPLGSTQSVELDVRLIASSREDLRSEVDAGTFRDDLFYRLHVVTIQLPLLRDRIEDVPLLAQHMLNRHAERMGKRIVGLSEAAMRQLTQYSWPGNVRELENTIEHAATLCEHNVVRAEDLPNLVHTQPDTDFLALAAAREMTLADLERAYMKRVLERTGGNKLRTAQILGVDRKTIYRWLGEKNEAETTSS